MNPVAESLTGWESREAQGRSIAAVFSLIDEATRAPSDNPVIRCLREIQVVGPAEHTVLVNPRGQEIAIQDSAAPILDRAGNLIGAVMVFHDVSKERRLHRALHYQASHDALTGLINRREFESRLTVAVVDADDWCAARGPAGMRVGYVPNVDDVPEHLLDHAPEGALVLMLGAGSISGAAARLARNLGTREAALR